MDKYTKCNHEEIVVMYHFGGKVELVFQCTKCGIMINKFDNSRKFTIVPNPNLDNAPMETGLWHQISHVKKTKRMIVANSEKSFSKYDMELWLLGEKRTEFLGEIDFYLTMNSTLEDNFERFNRVDLNRLGVRTTNLSVSDEGFLYGDVEILDTVPEFIRKQFDTNGFRVSPRIIHEPRTIDKLKTIVTFDIDTRFFRRSG